MLLRGLFFLGLFVLAVLSDMSLENRKLNSSAGCGYKCVTDADCAGLPCPQCVLVDNSVNYSLCSLKVTPTSTFQSVSISNEAGKISALTIVMDSPSNSMGSLEVLFDCSASPGCGCNYPSMVSSGMKNVTRTVNTTTTVVLRNLLAFLAFLAA